MQNEGLPKNKFPEKFKISDERMLVRSKLDARISRAET